MQAMIRSFQLVRAKFGKVFIIVVLSMLIQFSVFALLFRLFLPELDLLSTEDTEQIQIQIAAILENEGEVFSIVRTRFNTRFFAPDAPWAWKSGWHSLAVPACRVRENTSPSRRVIHGPVPCN